MGGGVRVDVNEIEVFFLGERVGGGVGVGLRGQSGCERSIEVFVKIQKKKFGGGVGGSGCQWEGLGWGGGSGWM